MRTSWMQHSLEDGRGQRSRPPAGGRSENSLAPSSTPPVSPLAVDRPVWKKGKVVIYSDRSRIVADQTCPRLRLYQYEWLGTGLQLGSARELDIGSCTHTGIGHILSIIVGSDHPDDTVVGLLAKPPALEEGLEAAHSDEAWARLEDTDRLLVDALVRTWWASFLPQLAGWRIVEVEREEVFDYEFPPSYWEQTIAHFKKFLSFMGVGLLFQNLLMPKTPKKVRFLSRLDLLAEAPEGVYLNGLPVAPGLYQFDWKTARKADERWATDHLYNQQWVSQLLGVEKRLGGRLEGTVVVGLSKEAHPLLGGWKSPSSDEVRTRYSWQCESAHVNDHTKRGGMCPGGKYHRLGDDWQLVPPSDPADWFERLRREDPALLAEQVRVLGPVRRASDWQIEAWQEQNFPREAEIAAARSAEPLDEATLRRVFPQREINCTRYGRKCSAFDVCWAGASLESFERRVPNHLEEKESIHG